MFVCVVLSTTINNLKPSIKTSLTVVWLYLLIFSLLTLLRRFSHFLYTWFFTTINIFFLFILLLLVLFAMVTNIQCRSLDRGQFLSDQKRKKYVQRQWRFIRTKKKTHTQRFCTCLIKPKQNIHYGGDLHFSDKMFLINRIHFHIALFVWYSWNEKRRRRKKRTWYRTHMYKANENTWTQQKIIKNHIHRVHLNRVRILLDCICHLL